jgi:hypothetical protein
MHKTQGLKTKEILAGFNYNFFVAVMRPFVYNAAKEKKGIVCLV